MKNLIIGILQNLLGYQNYLYLFSVIKIWTLRFDSRKIDYLRFVKMIQTEDNVLVIGANTGITTVPIARKNTTTITFAVEPVSQNLEVLKKVVNHFNCQSSVTIFPFALGDHRGKINMLTPLWGFTKKHGFAHVVSDDNDNEKGISTSCEIFQLDEINDLNHVSVPWIKIVAENYEFSIFSGARKFIERNKPTIYCELWDNPQRQKVLELVKSFGYKIFVFRNNKLTDYDPHLDKKKYFFFIHSEKLPDFHKG